MIIINRKMQTKETVKGNFDRAQASINSDGRITLRNYSPYDKDADEIMILSDTETRAIANKEEQRILRKHFGKR